jgi:hypothetical protein
MGSRGEQVTGGAAGGALIGAEFGGERWGWRGALFGGAVGAVIGGSLSSIQYDAQKALIADAMDTGGYTVNQKGTALHHQIVYGKTKIGGVVVFDHAHGTNNSYLSRIIAYAAHEIDAFEDIYIDNYKVTQLDSDGNVAYVREVDENGNVIGTDDDRFSGYIKIRKVLGGHTASLGGQSLSIDGNNFGETKWTSNHKLQGIAHLAIMFKYYKPEAEGDEEKYDNGLPSVTAIIRGKKVYDPRTGTTAWSDNPALIVRDYLTNTKYGLGESTSNIDDTRLTTAANICDETVTTDSSTRYTCNGAWLTSQVPVDLLNQLVATCAGMLWYAQGEWRIKAGKYVAPTITLNEDDLRGNLSISTRHSRRANFNKVRGTFKGPASNYHFTDYPTVESTLPLSNPDNFVTVDGGLESVFDFPLPFTDTPGEAQRLANIALERNRSQLTLVGTFGLKAFELQVGDVVRINNERLGFSTSGGTDLFEVAGWAFGLDNNYGLEVNLTLREITTSAYDEYQDNAFETDNTTLPGILGPTVIPGSGDVSSTTDVTGLTASGGVREIYINWTNPINNDFAHTKVYVNTTDNFSGATQLGSNVIGESTKHTGLSANDTRYYWAQAFTSSSALGSLAGSVSATVKDITTDDIENDAVTETKIAANAVTNTQLANNAVQSGNIFTSAVITDKIGDNAVSDLVAELHSFGVVPTSSIANLPFNDTITNNKAADIVLVANFETIGTPTSGDILYFEAFIDGATSGAAHNQIRATNDGIVGEQTIVVFASVDANDFDIDAKVFRGSGSSSATYQARVYMVVHRLFK